jgi:hypothetical protein
VTSKLLSNILTGKKVGIAFLTLVLTAGAYGDDNPWRASYWLNSGGNLQAAGQLGLQVWLTQDIQKADGTATGFHWGGTAGLEFNGAPDLPAAPALSLGALLSYGETWRPFIEARVLGLAYPNADATTPSGSQPYWGLVGFSPSAGVYTSFPISERLSMGLMLAYEQMLISEGNSVGRSYGADFGLLEVSVGLIN